jgi:hypothetical protein
MSEPFLSPFMPPFLPLNPRPSPPPRPLYKGRAPPPSTVPLPTLLLFSPHLSIVRTERLLCHFFTVVAQPPHYRPHPGEARAGIPVSPSRCCAPVDELPCFGVAMMLSYDEPPPPPLSAVHHGPAHVRFTILWTESIEFPIQNESPTEIPPHFAKNPPALV